MRSTKSRQKISTLLRVVSCRFVDRACLSALLVALLLITPTFGQNPRPTKPHSNHIENVGNSWGLVPNFAAELVRYPSPEIAFICGPQLKLKSNLNPFPWFDTTALKQGIYHGEQAPRIAPIGPMVLDKPENVWRNVIAGRVSVSARGTIVTGKGTRFSRDLDLAGPAPGFNGHFRIRDASGTERSVRVRSIESDTSLTLLSPWPYPSVTETVADTFYHEQQFGTNTDHYYLANYYDTALVQYINYYRTGDIRFLNYARKIADALWHSQFMGDGTVVQGNGSHLPPRSMAFAGLMLRALDGRPEMWDYLDREVRATFEHWVYNHKNDQKLYYDIREDGYAQLYAVMLAKVLPDSFPLYANGTLKPKTGVAVDGAAKRRTYLSQTEDTALNFFGRLQKPDGSWRWDEGEGPNPDENYRSVEQAFMVGLYLESLVLLHQQTQNAATKAKLLSQLTRAVRHLYVDSFERNPVLPNLPQYRWRGMFYRWGGGTVANPKKLNPPAPRTTISDEPDQIRGARHLNSTVHHAFGYAYYVTRDPSFKQMGDDVFDASYGDIVDGLHSLADSPKAKDYDMNYRTSGRYLVWRLIDGQSAAMISPPPRSVQKPVQKTADPKSPPRIIHISIAATPALHVAGSLNEAKRLSAQLSQKDQIDSLMNQIETAIRVFRTEGNKFVAPEAVIGELEAALNHVRTARSMTESASGGIDAAKVRLGWAAARLKGASDRVRPK
ncbi:MAG TPA: hypothetical protein VJU86_03750 [Pyrinomonadaceae bacterium]|nr:hypothetical protein [Pyrinomonadaceae bacterium]